MTGYEVATDRARLDRAYIHAFLTTSYWSPGIPRDVVDRAIDNSLNFGVYTDSGQQVGYARVVSDFATYAYLADVFIDPGHRGEGLGKHLIAAVVASPQLQGLRRFALATADAHGLYRQFGWAPPSRPEVHMFIERSPAELWGTGSRGPHT